MKWWKKKGLKLSRRLGGMRVRREGEEFQNGFYKNERGVHEMWFANSGNGTQIQRLEGIVCKSYMYEGFDMQRTLQT